MSFKSFLGAGIKTLFGGQSQAAIQTTPPVGNLVRAEDVQTIIETMKKMKDMHQAFMSVHEACFNLRHQIGTDFPGLDSLDHVTIKSSEDSVNDMLENLGMVQRWENIKVDDEIAAKVHVATFRNLAVTIMKNYSDTLVKCSRNIAALEAMDRIAVVERKDEISAKLNAAMEDSSDWSLKIHNVVFRICNYAETVNAPQRQLG